MLGAILFLYCLLLYLGTSIGKADTLSDPGPGEPPSTPPVEEFLTDPGPDLLAASSCSRPNCLFFPFMFRPYDVNVLERAEALSLYRNLYLPGSNISSGWNGNVASCVPGTTTPSFKNAILERVNFFRLAAGIPALKGLNDTYNTQAQAAALMMSKAGQLSHNPGTNWPCFSANGDNAAGNSNLYLGRYGPEAITGYVRDPGSGNTAVGHRRWILYPQTQQMGTGDIPANGSYYAANALWVFDSHLWDTRPDTRTPFVAWPPSGYIPYPVVFARWSFAYPNADFSNAKVSLSKNGISVSISPYTSVSGYGENTLVWIISGMGDGDSWPKPAADIPYLVTISGVVINGQSNTFSYPVIIFDPGS
jgi:uncharacterized protein YkwD